MRCCVVSCRSCTTTFKEKDVTFHRFPKDENIKKDWVRRIARRNWTPTKYSRICSKHFDLDDFFLNANIKWRRLKENSVPTLNMPDEADIKEELSDPECEIYINPDCEAYIQLKPVESLLETTRVQDIHPKTKGEDCSATALSKMEADYEQKIKNLEKELEKAKNDYKWLEMKHERANNVSKRRLRKINTLTKRISRLEKRNDELHSILVERLRKERIRYIRRIRKLKVRQHL